VKLTGIECQGFKSTKEVVARVVDMFVRALDSSVVHAPSKPYEGHDAFDMHTRYFSDQNEVPNEAHIPFSEAEDPFHIMEDLRGTQFICTMDNVVEYCAKAYDEQGLYE
jgi:hypothetical protein